MAAKRASRKKVGKGTRFGNWVVTEVLTGTGGGMAIRVGRELVDGYLIRNVYGGTEFVVREGAAGDWQVQQIVSVDYRSIHGKAGRRFYSLSPRILRDGPTIPGVVEGL